MPNSPQSNQSHTFELNRVIGCSIRLGTRTKSNSQKNQSNRTQSNHLAPAHYGKVIAKKVDIGSQSFYGNIQKTKLADHEDRLY